MIEKLKPCPFCGSDSLKLTKRKTTYKGQKAYVASVRCNRCKARGGTILNLTIPYAVKEDVENAACRKWNNRAAKETPLPVKYEADGYDDNGNLDYDTAYCPICHNQYEVDYDYHDNYCRKCGQKLDWSEENV